MLVWGFPVFYMPYFSSPDSTVNKQTGVLAPAFVSGGNLGYGFSIPYFINLAPNYDLTLIPTYLSKQGLFGEVDWRQRLDQRQVQHPGDRDRPAATGAFPAFPYGAGDQRLRGVDRNQGQLLPQRHVAVRLGRHLVVATNSSPTITSFRASTSATTISRTSSRRSICAARPTTASSTSAPIISRARRRTTTTAPCRQPSRYSTTIACSSFPPIAPTGSAAKRRSTSTSPTSRRPTRRSSPPACRRSTTPITSTTSARRRSATICCQHLCPGQVHAARHRRRLHARLGPGLVAAQLHRSRSARCGSRSCSRRLDGEATELNETGSITYASGLGTSTVANSSQAGVLLRLRARARSRAAWRASGSSTSIRSRLRSSWGDADDHADRPVHRSPERGHSEIQPNEDAQSLVFDETNLFAWNKFSGYDRIEGGTRLNYGAPIHRQFRQRRPRQLRRPANRSRSRGRIPTRSSTSPTPGWTPASTRSSPTSSPARRSSRPRRRSRS